MKSCLVVDDSSVIRKVARRILEDLDFDVSEAEDGQQALDFCRQQMPDLILLDWNMPVIGGVEFLAALRGQFAGKKPKVVFCASENDVASPVVPSTLRPSHPLSRRNRASAVERALSGSPLLSTAVAIAAMTPASPLLVTLILLAAAAASVRVIIRSRYRRRAPPC